MFEYGFRRDDGEVDVTLRLGPDNSPTQEEIDAFVFADRALRRVWRIDDGEWRDAE